MNDKRQKTAVKGSFLMAGGFFFLMFVFGLMDSILAIPAFILGTTFGGIGILLWSKTLTFN